LRMEASKLGFEGPSGGMESYPFVFSVLISCA
jgi:hypothetical protein